MVIDEELTLDIKKNEGVRQECTVAMLRWMTFKGKEESCIFSYKS